MEAVSKVKLLSNHQKYHFKYDRTYKFDTLGHFQHLTNYIGAPDGKIVLILMF